MDKPTRITIETTSWSLIELAARHQQEKPYPSRVSIIRIFGGDYLIGELNYEIRGGNIVGKIELQEIVPFEGPQHKVASFAPSIRDFSDQALIEEVKRREQEWRERNRDPNEWIDRLVAASEYALAPEDAKRVFAPHPSLKDGPDE